MKFNERSLLLTSARDIMSRDVVEVPQSMSVRDTAHMLFEKEITGAPVVDELGRCVGGVSRGSLAYIAMQHGSNVLFGSPLARSCEHIEHRMALNGTTVSLCNLASGTCPLQRFEESETGTSVICSQPQTVVEDWQIVEVQQLPLEQIKNYMTHNPVLVSPYTTLGELAQRMLAAHAHRVFVIDDLGRPIGVISGTDILAVIANLDKLEKRLRSASVRGD